MSTPCSPPTAEGSYSKLMDDDGAFHGFRPHAPHQAPPDFTSRLRRVGPQRLLTVGLAALCLVLLIAIIAVAAHNKRTPPKEEEASELQKQTQDANLTALSASNSRLQKEKEQLQKEKEQLQKEKEQLQKEKEQLQKEKEQLLLRLASSAAPATPPPPPSVSCPQGWRSFGGSCYYISTLSRSWPSAQSFCQQRGAHLAIILTAEEQTFLWDLLPRGHWNAYWFGITDEDTEDQWKWVDGTALVGGFWEEGEPNNHIDEDCGYIVKTRVLERVAIRSWYDAPCSMGRNFICEKEMDSSSGSAATTAQA